MAETQPKRSFLKRAIDYTMRPLVSAVEERSSLRSPSPELLAALGGGPTSSGAVVNPHTAMGVPAVTACVGILADMVGLLPLQLLRKTPKGDIPVLDHPAAKVITRPGDLHTALELRQLMMYGTGFGGNGYARVHRDGLGNPVELEWLAPCNVHPQRIKGRRFVTYRVDGVAEVLTRYDIIHIRGMSADGVTGVSPITQLRESIGITIAQRDAAGNLMSKGSSFNGVLEAPPSLKKEQVDDIRTEWAKKQEGAQNFGRTPVLWGVTFKQVSGMSAADAQFIESRRFELQEIARLYRIPPFLIGDTTGNTSWGSGIEQMNLGFLAYSLNPWLVMWEQSVSYTLLTTDEQAAGYHFEFDREELGAVSLQAKAAFITAMRTTSTFSINDCLEFLDRPKIESDIGDDHLLPLNSSSSGKPVEAEEPAEPTPATKPESVSA